MCVTLSLLTQVMPGFWLNVWFAVRGRITLFKSRAFNFNLNVTTQPQLYLRLKSTVFKNSLKCSAWKSFALVFIFGVICIIEVVYHHVYHHVYLLYSPERQIRYF